MVLESDYSPAPCDFHSGPIKSGPISFSTPGVCSAAYEHQPVPSWQDLMFAPGATYNTIHSYDRPLHNIIKNLFIMTEGAEEHADHVFDHVTPPT
jgi:hypothetical protein